MSLKVEKFENGRITDDILKAAAKLFNENYGIWGRVARYKAGVVSGARIRTSVRCLRELMPSKAQNVYVRVFVNGKLAGNVFATRWIVKHHKLCWITQLCVSSEHRNNGLAKLLLSCLQAENDMFIGILSSHPFAICAVARVFGPGIENVHLMTKDQASSIMLCCPISYISTARFHQHLLGKDESVHFADTRFWIDHEEPLVAVTKLAEKGVKWPFAVLPEGHEFTVIIEPKQWITLRKNPSDHRNLDDDKEVLVKIL